ncbi:MAG: TetR family transcriptional regulator [Nocardioidaceae bacterium]|nr:TetR family transcriptional regulator [Nocardioidaceae bacterium]
MTVERTRRNRKLDRPRERVLEEAWRLLAEKGLADLTLAELGRRVDTSASHLLYYFGSKDDLLLEVVRWSESQLREARAAALATGSVQTRLRRFCELYLPSEPGDPRWLLWIELWPRALRSTSLGEHYGDFDAEWRADLAALLEEAGARDATARARRICALLDGLSVALVLGEDGLTVKDAWKHVRALLPD